MTLPSPRLHPDPAPRMVTHWCHRAEGNPAAPCTCGMCDRPATDPATERGDWSWYAWVLIVFGVWGASVPIQNVKALVRWWRHALCGALYRAAEAVNDAPPPPASLTCDGARWRAVAAPDGTRALLSDREPGPKVGQPGELSGWQEASDPLEWGDFEDTAAEVRWWNAAIRGGAT